MRDNFIRFCKMCQYPALIIVILVLTFIGSAFVLALFTAMFNYPSITVTVTVFILVGILILGFIGLVSDDP